MGRPSQGEEFDLCLCAVGGKIEKEVSGFNYQFFSGGKVSNSYRQVFWRDGRV